MLQIPLTSLTTDRDLQPRAVPYVEAKVEEYTLALEAGDTFPAIVVTERNGSYVIVVGHNRAEAHRRAVRETITAEVIPDTGNADLFWRVAVPSNSTHGAGYDDEDKQAIFKRFLSEDRHRLPDGQIRSSPLRLPRRCPSGSHHATIDRWLKGRGIETTDKRGGARGFVAVRQKTAGANFVAMRQNPQSRQDAARDKRIADIRAQGATKLPGGGGWSLKRRRRMSLLPPLHPSARSYPYLTHPQQTSSH